MTPAEKRFDWPLCFEAENLVLARIGAFLERNSFARRLADRMRNETGTLLLDWVDHIVVPAAEESEWRAVGFVDDPLGETPANQNALWHPEAMLPRVLLDRSLPEGKSPAILAIRPESIGDFVAPHQLAGEPEGEPLSRFRRLVVHEEPGARIEAVERRGYRGNVAAALRAGEREALMQTAELWRSRRRDFPDDTEGYRQAQTLVDQVIRLVGRDLACHVVFAGERVYWESRNRAAQVQKARQDKLGLGWGNHDHHTFRSSREHFVDLMRALEKLGFSLRNTVTSADSAARPRSNPRPGRCL